MAHTVACLALVSACCAAALPYRIVAIDLGVGNPAEGPSADPAQVAGLLGKFDERLARVQALGYTHVLVPGLENYVPLEPVGERARRFRPYLEAAVRATHARGMKLLLYGDEALYRPEWLERAGADASVKDPRFWEMLAEKYRRLLRAFPDLDGLAFRFGEVIPYHGFESLDLLHSAEGEPNPRIEERVRRFVLTAHRVVAGEFGRLLLVRTWATNDWGLHSVPEIFRATFTQEVPCDRLLVSIKLTKQDAWYYGSAFNPTFGQSPHVTVAEAELYSQYHGLGTLVDFPARWFASALRHAVARGAQGVLTGHARPGLMGSAIFHVFSRLARDPGADEEKLTREWAAQEFGGSVADAIAEILLQSGAAARDVFYWPAFPALGWNPLPHVRVNRIAVRGEPLWDEGRGHDEFLRELYLMSRPFLNETRESVERGYRRYAELRERFAAVRDRIERAEARLELGRLLDHSVATALLLRDYTRTILSYGQYCEHPSDEARKRLAADMKALQASAAAYRRSHSFYELAGVNVTLDLAARMVEDRERAERILREAPTREQLLEKFARAREQQHRALAADPQAEKIVHWRGTVDARATVMFRGREAEVRPLAGDGVPDAHAQFLMPVEARRGGRWLLRVLRGRGVVYLMEEPSSGKSPAAVVYLDDPQPGNAVYEFELYWSGAATR